MPESTLIQALFERGAQYGYSKTKRHPSIAPFIFTSKNRGDIIDLEQTAVQVESAQKFLKELAAAGKVVVFVGTKPEVRDTMRAAANSINAPFVDNRWIGGTLTNFSEIKKRTERLLDLEYRREHNELIYKTKKERLMLEREIIRLQKNFGGIAQVKKTPDAIFVVDPLYEHIAVAEAISIDIPIIALANTDCDIRELDYPIVANDSTRPSVEYIVSTMRDALKK